MVNKTNLIFVIFVFLAACAKAPSLELQPKSASDPTHKQQPHAAGTCTLFFEVERLCAEFIWESIPDKSQIGAFIVKYFVQETPAKFIDPTHQPAVVVYYPADGHFSRTVTVEQIASGEYRAKNIVLDRSGDWEIQLQMKDKNSVVDQVIKKFSLK